MFFYTGFLRTPPHTSDSMSVSVTPQIANDLRTIYLDDASDIFYAWSPTLRDCGKSSLASTARKLTTWRRSSMYKSIPIPLPPNAKSGQEWRLALVAGVNGQANFVIDLADKKLGAYPLPVVSMPVQLEQQAKKAKSLVKQEQIERLYAIPNHETQPTLLYIREQTSFELDKKIWDSGLGLSSWLTNVSLSESIDNLETRHLKNLLIARKDDDRLRILELGAGTGIVSICLATLLGKSQYVQDVKVFATDLPSAIELIQHNVTSNKSAYPELPLEVSILDWNDETLPPHAREPIDLLVMADVTYNTASFPALVRTIETIVKSSRAATTSRSPSVLLAYKQRDEAERDLWPMLSGIGIHMNLIDNVSGAGGEAVEIWLWNGDSDGIK